MRGGSRMRVSRVVVAAVLAALTSLLHFSCEKLAGSNVSQTNPVASVAVADTWAERAVQLLAANRCEDLRSLLKSVPAAEVNERWFRLHTLGEGMCWSHSRSDHDKQTAFQAVDDGLARYPNS